MLINGRAQKRYSLILRSSLECLGNNTVVSFSVRTRKTTDEEAAIVKTRR